MKPAVLVAAGFGFRLTGNLLDAGDHLVHGFVDWDLVIENAVRSLRPHILIVEDGELVVSW